jgi:hypothetical protein
MKTSSLLCAAYNVMKNVCIYVPCSGPPPEFWHRLHIGLICHQRGKAVESQAMAEGNHPPLRKGPKMLAAVEFGELIR